jgi:hypothetical protein
MLSVREGRLGRFGETHSVTIALAPPNLVLQRIEDLSFALIDPPLTISRDEIKNVSCTEMGIGVELKVKLAAGPQVKLVLLSGEIYGDSGTTELRAKTTAAGDAITAWLKNPS